MTEKGSTLCLMTSEQQNIFCLPYFEEKLLYGVVWGSYHRD